MLRNFALSAACVAIGMGLSPATAGDLPDIRARGLLRVVVSADEQPEFFSFTLGSQPGFERELLEGFARLHRVGLEVLKVEQFDQLIPTIKEGRADLGTGLIVTEERRVLIDFTAQVLPARPIVVSRAPSKPVANVQQLRLQTVGVVPGTAWARAVKEAGVPPGRIKDFVDRYQLFEGLREGRISALVTSLSEYLVAKRQDPTLQLGTFLGAPVAHAWGVGKENPELRRALDDYLTNTRRAGSWNRLVVKYFGEDTLAVLDRARSQ